MLSRRKRPRTAARENHASSCNTYWDKPIGVGQFRKVFKGMYTEGEQVGKPQVSKVFKDGTAAYEDSYFAGDLAVVEEAINIVDKFNQVKKFKSVVQVCKPRIWTRRDSKQRILVEPYISAFQKFNSNTGWLGSNNWSQAMQALSHFSYHHSSGELVLCDLQGGLENDAVVLTDPAINSRAGKYGPADLGAKGIENFFHQHVCSEWCDRSWKKPQATHRHFNPTMGTSMMIPA
eukprot:3278657-Amphidinium_carterae.1